MFGSWRLLDRILRGDATRPGELREGRLTFPIGGLSVVGIVLAMIYGAFMGCYSIFRAFDGTTFTGDYRQLSASTVKTPLLFFLTLVVTFPSLYVFNALVGSRLTFVSVLKLLIAALGVNLAVLASLGPIVAFFSLSTNSYGFMVLLNVAVFAVSGALGLTFLIQTLSRLQRSQEAADRVAAAQSPAADDIPVLELASAADIAAAKRATPPPGALDRTDVGFQRQVRVVFGIWIFVFGLVGAQMGWILRPFIGDPTTEFSWLRRRESNFFEAVGNTFVNTVFGTSRTDYDQNDLRRSDDGGGFRLRRSEN
jgi:hypothetical protein